MCKYACDVPRDRITKAIKSEVILIKQKEESLEIIKPDFFCQALLYRWVSKYREINSRHNIKKNFY